MKRDRKRGKRESDINIRGNYVAFCCIWATDKWGIWLVQSFYVTQFFRGWGFWWRGFSSWRDFFYFPAFCMDIGYILLSNHKTSIFIEVPPRKILSRLANQLQIILYASITFWLVSPSNDLIYVNAKSITSAYQFLIDHPTKLQYMSLVN